MRDSVKTFIWYLGSAHAPNVPPPILEVGARHAPGQTGYADMRPFFRGKEYIGYDSEAGPGVDDVGDVLDLAYPTDSMGTVLCLDTLEHISNPRLAMAQMQRVLIPGGVVVISTHMAFPVHYKPDLWRFTPECVQDVLLESFGVRDTYYQGDESFPHCLIGLGVKGDSSLIVVDLPYLNAMLPYPYPWPFHRYSGAR